MCAYIINCNGCTTILSGGYIAIKQKADLPDTRDNAIITRKVHADGNKLCLGKNGGYIPSSLGGSSISVCRQTVRQKFLQFGNFNSVNSKA